jgi:hypothetical protein
MFTWICPTCGREVPPAYKECPDCAARGVAPPPEAAAMPPAPPATGPEQPAVQVPVVPPPVAAPPPHGLPTWLLTVLFIFAFVGLGASVYWVAHVIRGSNAAAYAPPETAPIRHTGKEHPLQKYIEVTGIRFLENAKKEPEAHFVIINHSGADINDLAGTVNIWGRTERSEEEAAGNFSFKIPSLGPYESKDLTAPVNTKLKVYELPDWQNISAEVQITSP